MTTQLLAQNLRDPRVHASRLTETLVVGLGTVVVAPARMPRGLLRLTHAASGLVGAAGGAVAVGEDAGVRARVGTGAALGALMLGLSVAGAAADTRSEAWLRGRGVRRPRWVMGAALGAFTLASLWAVDLTEGANGEEGELPADDPVVDA